MTRPGPKLDHLLGPVSKRNVMLDDLTVAMALALGANVSDGIRKAVRVAYGRYQATADVPVVTPNVPLRGGPGRDNDD